LWPSQTVTSSYFGLCSTHIPHIKLPPLPILKFKGDLWIGLGYNKRGGLFSHVQVRQTGQMRHVILSFIS